MSFFKNTIVQFIILLIILCTIFSIFIFHNVFIGQDEFRTTLVPCEISKRGDIYFKDINNIFYSTDIFVKGGFNLNKNNTVYPFGFILNSLINLPFFSLAGCNNISLNTLPILVYVFISLMLYSIFRKLNLNRHKSILGSVIFSLSNFYLVLYVSYYPDFVLIFFTVLLFWLFLKYKFEILSIRITFLSALICAFLFATKITVFPALCSLLVLYFIYLYKRDVKLTKLTILALIYISVFVVFLFPTLYSFKVGPSYNTQQNANGTATMKLKNKSFLQSFTEDYLFPKQNGEVLISHVGKDIYFFSINNFYILLGFIATPVLLYKKNKFAISALFITFLASFWFWGNMNVYTGSDDFDLRNSHIRYMLPVFIIFFILGYYYFIERFNKKMNLILISFIVIRLFISLHTEYPFTLYSLANRSGYFYQAYLEKKKISELPISNNSIVLSADFDDFDLSYYFENYGYLEKANLEKKSVSNLISHISANTNYNVFLILPKNVSRYSSFSYDEISDLNNKFLKRNRSNLIYNSDTLAILKIK